MDLAFTTLSVDSRKLLRKAGFKNAKEVLALGGSQLAKELGVELSVAFKLLQEIQAQRTEAPKAESAFDLVRTMESNGARHLTTFCRPFDEMLDGGFSRGALTELCGAPGSGKTQICMQLSVNVSIPEAFAGLDGEALYLDTEGSFSPERVKMMAEALSASLNSKAGSQTVVPTAEIILERIHVARAHDRGELLAFVQNLPQYLSAHPRTKLVVLDSIAHHFRHDYGGDVSSRGKILARLAQEFNKIAHDYDIVVICSNHMTTRPDSQLVPALGEHWFHGVTNRLIITNTQDIVEWRIPRKHLPSGVEHQQDTVYVTLRRAEITKASSVRLGNCEFVVVGAGIRPLQRQQSSSQGRSDATEATGTTKRQREI